MAPRQEIPLQSLILWSRTVIDSSNPGLVAPPVYLFIKQRGNEGALNIPASGGIFTFHAATGTKQFYILGGGWARGICP